MHQKKFPLPNCKVRRAIASNNTTKANATNRTDENLTDRIGKFTNLIGQKNTYRVSLKFLTNIDLVDQPIKLNTKIMYTFETYLNKLFESNKQVATVTTSDAEIIWHDAPFIQYEKFRLNGNFRQYLETYCQKKVFRMGIQETPLLQKPYKLLRVRKAILSSLQLQIDNPNG